MLFLTFEQSFCLFQLQKTLHKVICYKNSSAGSKSALKKQLDPDCIEKNSWIQIHKKLMRIYIGFTTICPELLLSFFGFTAAGAAAIPEKKGGEGRRPESRRKTGRGLVSGELDKGRSMVTNF